MHVLVPASLAIALDGASKPAGYDGLRRLCTGVGRSVAVPVPTLGTGGDEQSVRLRRKLLSKVAVVAEYASLIPGPVGTIAGFVSAGAYAATGN